MVPTSSKSFHFKPVIRPLNTFLSTAQYRTLTPTQRPYTNHLTVPLILGLGAIRGINRVETGVPGRCIFRYSGYKRHVSLRAWIGHDSIKHCRP